MCKIKGTTGWWKLVEYIIIEAFIRLLYIWQYSLHFIHVYIFGKDKNIKSCRPTTEIHWWRKLHDLNQHEAKLRCVNRTLHYNISLMNPFLFPNWCFNEWWQVLWQIIQPVDTVFNIFKNSTKTWMSWT